MQFFQSPERDYIYQLVYNYYDNPTMIKVKDADDRFSMYACQLPCLLMNEKRYLIVLGHKDYNTVGDGQELKDFRWISFQARSLQEEAYKNLPIHNYKIKREDKYMIPLKIKSRSNEISIYDTELPPLTVSLLHCKNQEYEYPNEGNLVSALETFQTVLQWDD